MTLLRPPLSARTRREVKLWQQRVAQQKAQEESTRARRDEAQRLRRLDYSLAAVAQALGVTIRQVHMLLRDP